LIKENEATTMTVRELMQKMEESMPEMYDAMLDEQIWSDSACFWYAECAAKAIGLTQEKRRELLDVMYDLQERIDVKQAEWNWHNGE
jgi:hypothetical protein